MATLDAQIIAAREAKYTDEQIAEYLATVDPRVKAALAHYPAAEVLAHIVNMPSRDPTVTDADRQDVPAPKLNKTDLGIATQLAQSPLENASNREQETELRHHSRTELETALKTQQDPALRAIIQQQLDALPKGPVMPAAPAAPGSVPEMTQGEAPAQRDPRSLEMRQDERAKLEDKDRALATQEQQLTRQWQRGNSPTASPQTRQQAEVAGRALENVRAMRADLQAQIEKTGVGDIGRTVGSMIGSTVGGAAGGAAGAAVGNLPGALIGATAGGAAGAAGGGALGTKYDLWRARQQAQDVTPEEAFNLIKDRAIEDALWDAAGSILMLGAGKVFRVIADKNTLARLIKQQHAAVTAERSGIAENRAKDVAEEFFDPTSLRRPQDIGQEHADMQARAEAVKQLSDRAGDYVPTPGQITGKPSTMEQAARRTGRLQAGDDAIYDAAEAQRRDLLNAPGAASSKDLGNDVVDMLNTLRQRVQTETKPAFEASKNPVSANGRPFVVYEAPYFKKVTDLLERDAKSGFLKSDERQWLNEQKDRMLRTQFRNDAEGTIDTISAMKARQRGMSIEGAPSREFAGLLGDMIPILDAQYEKAASRVGSPQIYDALMQARDRYAEMSHAVFDDEMSKAMRASPERVGALLWTRGHVSGPEQLHAAQDLARRAGSATEDQVKQMNADILRGFLQNAVKNPEDAANWSQIIASDAGKRETFDLLSKAAGAQGMARGMELVEQGAKVALSQQGPGKAGSRAAQLLAGAPTAGTSHGRGIVNIPLLAAGLILDAFTVGYSTALQQGNRGIVRDLTLLMKAGPVAGATTAGPVRAAAARVARWSADNGIQMFQTNPQVEVQDGQ